jgi:hypothetical protein
MEDEYYLLFSRVRVIGIGRSQTLLKESTPTPYYVEHHSSVS